MKPYRFLLAFSLALTCQAALASEPVPHSSWKALYTAIANEVLENPGPDDIFELGLKSIGTFHPLADGRVLILLRLGYHEGFMVDRDPVRNTPRVRYKNPRFCSKSSLDCRFYVVLYDKDRFRIVNRFRGSIVKYISRNDPISIKFYERRGDEKPKDVCYRWTDHAFREAPCQR